MKQRITASQVLQLTAEQQEQMRRLWIPQEGDYIYFSGQEEMVYYLNGVDKSKSLPLFSLGQLMSILNERHEVLSILYSFDEWKVTTPCFEACAVELCDALWRALVFGLKDTGTDGSFLSEQGKLPNN